jgi:uncharacterized membrane protein
VVITTKFEVGETVWLIKDSKTITDIIGGIYIMILKPDHLNDVRVRISYHMLKSFPEKMIGEDVLFKSKDELLKSLA